jgi:hypothetical protein
MAERLTGQNGPSRQASRATATEGWSPVMASAKFLSVRVVPACGEGYISRNRFL